MSQSQKEAAEYAEVLLAYSRGETIQMRFPNDTDNGWGDLTYPLWDFNGYEYRLMPKKPTTVCYVLVMPTGELAETSIVSDSIEYLRGVYKECLDAGYRIAKVCEVTE